MISMLTEMVAAEHRADLRRAAERPASRTSLDERHTPRIELRHARPADAGIVCALAELDDAPPLEAPVLLALMDGGAVAALSLADGRVLADPFVATAHAVSLLQLRAEHLASSRVRRRRRWRLPRLRLA